MPTPEEIKSICTEYVDELFAFDDMQDQENIEAKNDAFVMCMAFTGHILEKHCIVPKSKVQEEYSIHSKNVSILTHTQVTDLIEYFKGRKEQLESLFGKELFNEEK